MRSSSSTEARGAWLGGLPLVPLAALLIGTFFVPLAVLFLYSFWSQDIFSVVHRFNLHNYATALDGFYLRLLGRSLLIGTIVAGLSVALAYPFAYAATFRFRRIRNALLFASLLSLFTSYLVRVYAFQTILGDQGVVNSLLRKVGLIDHPLSFLLFNSFAVVITLTNVFLPYVLLPIWAAMQNVERSHLEAARDLGARPLETFRKVVLPATRGGALAGFVFAFVLASGDYVTPTLVGGTNGLMIGRAISDSFGLINDMPLGSALAFVLLAAFGLCVALVPRLLARLAPARGRLRELVERPLRRTERLRLPGAHLWAHLYVLLILLFLFVPLAIIVVLSFNTRPVPAFPMRGLTLHWYRTVFSSSAFSDALVTSIELAAATALVGGLLGTLAAIGLNHRRLRFRGPITALLTVPLAMPGLITGVAMLTFYVATGVPLSETTIGIGHVVYATPFVVLALAAALRDLDPDLAEAGRDLGRGPIGVFRTVVLPLVFPAIAGAALVAAALSLDEFVITNFVSGSTVTLPLYIWAKLRVGVTPDTNAVSTLILAGLSLLVACSYGIAKLARGQRPNLLGR